MAGLNNNGLNGRYRRVFEDVLKDTMLSNGISRAQFLLYFCNMAYTYCYGRGEIMLKDFSNRLYSLYNNFKPNSDDAIDKFAQILSTMSILGYELNPDYIEYRINLLRRLTLEALKLQEGLKNLSEEGRGIQIDQSIERCQQKIRQLLAVTEQEGVLA